MLTLLNTATGNLTVTVLDETTVFAAFGIIKWDESVPTDKIYELIRVTNQACVTGDIIVTNDKVITLNDEKEYSHEEYGQHCWDRIDLMHKDRVVLETTYLSRYTKFFEEALEENETLLYTFDDGWYGYAVVAPKDWEYIPDRDLTIKTYSYTNIVEE